jgi:hypothetical protein
MCRRRREMDFASVARSPSLSQSRRQIASATRNGIRVCRALSLSLRVVMGRRRWDVESASIAHSISSLCVVGDETGHPRLSRSLSLVH